MYNKVVLMGRITHDLELKTTQSGVSVCHFQMAVDRRYQTKGEEKKTDFFRVTAWRQTAEFITRYFRKGSLILVEGELQTSSYTDKNGNNVNAVEAVVDQASFTGEKRDDVSASGHQAQSAPAPNYQAQYGGSALITPPNTVADDNYPFY